jgi:hypothetical protein
MRFRNTDSLVPSLLVILVVVLAWFSPWWLQGKNLAPLDIMHQMMQPWRGTSEQVTVKNHFVSDAVDNYLVYRIFAEKSYKTEGWVGWSSLTYGGTAQYANTMALYYDWTMQLHRWFDFWTAWHLGIIGQALLAATGMLLFLRRRSIGPVWATCGALAYAANSQFVTWINHRWALSAFCWVPWILWSIDSYRQGRRSFRSLVPAFIAMALLGGSLQHCAFVAIVVVAMWGEEALVAGLRLKVQLRLFGRYAVWGMLGCGLAAMMLLPCTAAYIESSQLGLHSTAHMGTYPQGYAQPLFNLLAYPLQIFPSILGRPCTMDALKAFKSNLFFIAYFGSLPVLIAYLAIVRKGIPPLARLLILFGLVIPLTPLVKFLYQRIFLVSILGGIYAFVSFMETAGSVTRKRIAKVTGIIASIIITVWTVASIVLSKNTTVVETALDQKFLNTSSGGSFGHFRNWMHERMIRFVADFPIWSPQQLLPLGLFIVSLVGFRLTASPCSRRRATGSLIIVFGVVAELTLFGSRWLTYVDPVQYPLFPITPEVSALRKHVGNGRVTTLIKSMEGHMAETPFIPNTLVPYGVATIGGFDSLTPNGMVLPNESPDDADKLGRFGVSHLLTCHGNSNVPDDWTPVWSSPSMDLYENTLKMPIYAGFKDDNDKEAFYSGRRTKVIPIRETSGLENRRRLEVPTGTRWIRIAENQASGWEFREGSTGSWSPVHRSSDASMIFLNPDSSHSAVFEMRYNPPLRRLGIILSLISVLATVLFGIRRPRRQTHLIFHTT